MFRSALRLPVTVGLMLAVAACAQPAPSPSAQPSTGGTTAPDRPVTRRVLNMALNTLLDGFSIAASSTTAGGGLSYIEIHSQALFTADKTTGRPVPRLLAEQPTVDNGGLQVTADGKMVATYRLRPDVKWADGEPLTSDDLMFTFRLSQDPLMPFIDRGATALMESATAPDATTFVVTYKQPYYMADALGLRAFWPLPAHLLRSDYESDVTADNNPQRFLQRPYWTTDYVQVGPFKLVEFNPGVEADFEAVDGYFLGRPKIDRIVVKQFADVSAELAAILAGAVDLGTDGTLAVQQGMTLKQQWDQDGGGRVYFGTGTTRFVSVQFDSSVPDYQVALQDVRVRRALYFALDRDALADAVSAGVPDRAANELVPSDNPLHSYVKGGFKQAYPFDLSRATSTFAEAGWRPGSGGLLTNGDGATLGVDVPLGGGDLGTVATAIADFWKRAGVDSRPHILAPELQRDAHLRSQFPGIEVTARGAEDSILTRLECGEQPTSQNHYAGNNRGHWCNPDYESLVNQYRTSLNEDAQGRTVKQIQELIVDQLPIMPIYYNINVVYARKGVTAFQDDFAGGADQGRLYGTYSRNAHEWDIQQ